MGYYINPPNGEEKETFLAREGRPIPEPQTFAPLDGQLPVVLVHNPWFTAAGVVYSAEKLLAFTDASDTRFKLWFSVPIAKLIPVVQPNLKEVL